MMPSSPSHRSARLRLIALAIALGVSTAPAAAAEAKPNVVYFWDFEDGKLPPDQWYVGGIDIATDIALGGRSARATFNDPAPADRTKPVSDHVFNAGPIPCAKEGWFRWYLYLDKTFDLPGVSDGYWAAPPFFGLKSKEGFGLHFFTLGANGVAFSTYLAKAGAGFRIILLSQENAPEDKTAWIANATPEFRRKYDELFPWDQQNGETFKGTEYFNVPWNPNYVWIYGTKDGEREPMLGLERWYCIEIHLKAASAPKKKDGVIEMWLDGKPVVSRRNLDNDRGSLNNCMLRGPFHDHDCPPVGSHLYVDNLVVDTGAYIGPIGARADLKEREALAKPNRAAGAKERK
jgi:hypothetical protein